MIQTINLDFDTFAAKAEQGCHLLVWPGNVEAAKACALIDEDAIVKCGDGHTGEKPGRFFSNILKNNSRFELHMKQRNV